MWVVGTVSNFCTLHASLREMAGKAVRGRTPATAAGITRRCWSVGELLSYHVPPPPWTPPTKRGRRSREMLALIAGIPVTRDILSPQSLRARAGWRLRDRGNASMWDTTASNRSGNSRRKNREAGVESSGARQSKVCSALHTW
jgi:hypothetical protein